LKEVIQMAKKACSKINDIQVRALKEPGKEIKG
jgi:hypothetical protein